MSKSKKALHSAQPIHNTHTRIRLTTTTTTIQLRQTKCISVGVQHSAITHTFQFLGFLRSFRFIHCVYVYYIFFFYVIESNTLHTLEEAYRVRVRVRKGKVQSFLVTIDR